MFSCALNAVAARITCYCILHIIIKFKGYKAKGNIHCVVVNVMRDAGISCIMFMDHVCSVCV